MTEYTLGQRVRFSHPLQRALVEMRYVTRTEGEFQHKLGINKEWLPTPSKEFEGIIVGKRTLANGYGGTETDPGDDWFGHPYTYPVWSPAEHFTAWLVVKDLRSKPVLVLPEHVTAVEG